MKAAATVFSHRLLTAASLSRASLVIIWLYMHHIFIYELFKIGSFAPSFESLLAAANETSKVAALWLELVVFISQEYESLSNTHG